MNERTYFMICIRAFAQAKNWEDVNAFVTMKKPPVAHAYIAEICYDYGNIPMAV
jgi:hypothetical protein